MNGYSDLIMAFVQSALYDSNLHGRLEVVFPEQDFHIIGEGPFIGRIRINTWDLLQKLLSSPDQSVVFGEGYANRDIEIEGDESTILGTLYLSGHNRYNSPFHNIDPTTSQDKYEDHIQSSFVQATYDGVGNLYRLFLDNETMCYTSGYFPTERSTWGKQSAELAEFATGEQYHIQLEKRLQSRIDQDTRSLVAGQTKKLEMLCRKIRRGITPECQALKILDIGCGWGGLLEQLSKMQDVEATGLTLSRKQADYIHNMETLAESSNVSVVVSNLFEYECKDKYDGIVSVGMIEHVGEQRIEDYARKIRKLLATDGVVVIHGMSNTAGLPMNPFLEKYIFPGAYIPKLSHVILAFEKAGFDLKHFEGWRNSYMITLELWETAYRRNKCQIIEYWDKIREKRPNEFPESSEYYYRIWLFYLISARAAFEYGVVRVGQYVFTPVENGRFQDDYLDLLEK